MTLVRMLLSACLTIASCPGSASGDEPVAAPVHLTILGINDLHGALLDRPVGTPVDTPRRGGAAMLSAYIEAVRDENPGGTLVVDAGDMLQGPLLCNQFEGLPVAEVYNHFGVVAAALGNHDLDYGPVGDESLPSPDTPPFGALEAFVARADFPVLSANLAPAEWSLPAGVEPHVVADVMGVRVGLIGLSTPTTPTQTRAERVAGVRFEPLAPAVADAVAALRGQGAEVIVVLGHLDGGCLTSRRWPPPEVCEPDGELVDVLEGGAGQVDAVFLGHRHAWLANQVDGVAVVEAGSRGRALSRVDLYVDPVTRRVDRTQTRISSPIAACEAAPTVGDNCLTPDAEGPWGPATYGDHVVVPDPRVDAILAPYLAQVEAICAEPLAVAAVPIGRGEGESAAGNLVTDAMRASRDDVHFAIVNSGALRADMAAGPISLCDVVGMYPFDARMVELETTGAELESILEFLTSGAHSLPQVSGMRLVIDGGAGTARDLDGDGESQPWERDRLLAVSDEQGLPLASDAIYRLLINDYLIERPGDAQFVFGQVPSSRVTPLPDLVRDAILASLRAQPQPLGSAGGWPLPKRDHPRISFTAPE